MSTERRVVKPRLIAGGAILVVASVLFDTLRGQELSFGLLQTLMVGAGLAAVAFGALGSRIPEAWRAVAVLLLNVLLLFMLVNLAARAVLRRIPPSRYAGSVTLPWYAAQPWIVAYRSDFPRVNDLYSWGRWVMWQGTPFRGQMINVDSIGRRRTPGDDCAGDAFVIWALGGSTMWGVGSPDSLTIPALLKASLDRRYNRVVCVVNLGERAYNSSQELLRLQGELREGRRPQLVVAYDGLNDVTYAMRSGDAGSFQDEATVAQRIFRRAPGVDWMNTFAVVQLAREARRRSLGLDTLLAFQARRLNADSLARATAAVYAANHRIIAALGDGFHFETLFFLQPMIAVGSKQLSAEETSSFGAMPAAQKDFYRKAFDAMYATVKENPKDGPTPTLVDLRGVLDGEPRALYIDWFHLSPIGNAIVAERIATSIESSASFQNFLRVQRSTTR